MATQAGDQFETDERLARLREILSNGEKLQLEGQKLSFERNKLEAERLKLESERLKMDADRLKVERDTRFSPWLVLAQGALAAAALMGAGVAFARLFLA